MQPTPGQSGPESDGNEGLVDIPKSSSITGTSPSDCLVSYPGQSFVGVLIPLQRSSQCILLLHPTVQAVIRKDSASLFKFPFLSHIQVFSCEILSVCRWKYLYSCFSSHFCSLVIVILLIFTLPILFLIARINLCYFFM